MNETLDGLHHDRIVDKEDFSDVARDICQKFGILLSAREVKDSWHSGRI
jgi:hypothetical protein